MSRKQNLDLIEGKDAEERNAYNRRGGNYESY